jgi:organic hydroperoxide reductase OsmC/OhrA
MSEYTASVRWRRTSPSFDYEGFSRDHTWRLGGGAEVRASAPPEYLGNPECTNPEQALVAALSACHMLTFLAIAAKKRFVVEAYADEPVGILEPNEDGRLALTRATLRPVITFGGERTPTAQDLARMHYKAQKHCFIANSVRTVVGIESEHLTCPDLASPQQAESADVS